MATVRARRIAAVLWLLVQLMTLSTLTNHQRSGCGTQNQSGYVGWIWIITRISLNRDFAFFSPLCGNIFASMLPTVLCLQLSLHACRCCQPLFWVFFGCFWSIIVFYIRFQMGTIRVWIALALLRTASTESLKSDSELHLLLWRQQSGNFRGNWGFVLLC